MASLSIHGKRLSSNHPYTLELGEEICRRLSNGETVFQICEDHDFPEPGTIFNWAFAGSNDREGPFGHFFEIYTRARGVQADAFADQIIYLSDVTRRGTIVTEKLGAPSPDGTEVITERKVVTQDMTERTKIQIDARKWVAARIAPWKYGDRIAHQLLDQNGEPTNKLEIVVTES